MIKVFLKPSREKSLLKRHPWVYSGAIGKVEGECVNGSTVMVCSSRGEFLAWASISPSDIKGKISCLVPMISSLEQRRANLAGV